MMRRTIKPAAGDSSVTAEAAKAAARAVYRDRVSGKLIVVERRRGKGTTTRARTVSGAKKR